MKSLTQGKYEYVLPATFSDEEALELKMNKINPKIFGIFCPVKYELKHSEKVQVPYLFLVFDYRLIRSRESISKNTLGRFDREGQIGIIYDLNEAHPFHYDLLDDLGLIRKKQERLEGRILKPACSIDEAVEASKECAKWEYLKRAFHAVPQITVARKQMFYREAIKLELESNGKQYIKYAYKDNFGTENEHVSGLKVRLQV